MPRREIRFQAGGYYHIFNRGANHMSICRNHGNFIYLLGLMKKYLAQLDLTMIAYCLLPNHYHWLVRQDGATRAGQLPQSVFNAYSKAFNKATGHTGTLFEGRYKIIAVTRDPYLHHLCRYIHANPVRHGLATHAHLWPYSNFQDWLKLRDGTLVDHNFVQDHFGTPERYRLYLDAYLTGQNQPPRGLEDYLTGL